jgi:hypothetical protein
MRYFETGLIKMRLGFRERAVKKEPIKLARFSAMFLLPSPKIRKPS